MIKIKSTLKELLQSKFQIIVFLLCLILSIGTFIAIDSLKSNTEDYIQKDSKSLNGGDIIIDSNREYSTNLSLAINEVITKYPDVILANSYTFSSIVYSKETDASLLSEIRIVSENYPLYGSVSLKSNENLSNKLKSGQIIVEQNLLDRLNLTIGSTLKIGDTNLIISDVLISEPDSPLNLFKLGPKILISENDLDKLNLISDKSRVSYETYIKTSSEDETFEILEFLNSKLSVREKANYYFDENNSLKSFVLNFLFFIKLISLFIIILTGVAITSIILSYLEDKKISIGIRKSLGEKNDSILQYYYFSIILVSFIGSIFAIIFAYFLIIFFPQIFQNILPKEIEISLSLFSVLKGIFISFIITTLFILSPLYNLRKISPIQIFRNEEINIDKTDKYFYLINSFIFLFFIFIIFIELEDFLVSSALLIGFIILFLALYFITHLILKLSLKYKNKIKNLELKSALNGLFRIGNKTTLIIVTICISLTILFTISFINLNLQNQFVNSFPENAPNFFVLDVPKENLSDIEKIIGNNVTFYPVIRGNIININQVSAQEIEEKKGIIRGDSLTRTFSLTYGDLLNTEKVIESTDENQMFDKNFNKENIVQVSVLDTFANENNLKIGDRIIFLIQGVEIESEIVSIRTRKNEEISAFFYFTFEAKDLQNAPQNVFTITRVESEKIPFFQNEIVKKFPQVTVINGETTSKTVGEIIQKLSKVISFFTLFSIGAGILILLSSIISTNEQRTKEAVFYKLIGANKKFISKVFIYEYLIIGILSSIIAIIFSILSTFLITKYILNIEFVFLTKEIFIYSIITIITILLIGILSSIKVIHTKPIEYIRQNKVE